MTAVTRGDDETVPRTDETVRMTAWVRGRARGRVQRIGFRWFTRAAAMRIASLDGFAANLGDRAGSRGGRGAPDRCDELLGWLRTGDTPGRVAGVTEIWGTPNGGYDGFEIR